ncbi:MAG: glycosyltransferase family 4 protein [Gracilimonas sp.]|nr:glycosyltransferase family 4 protein [Gracilimonas sp.]
MKPLRVAILHYHLRGGGVTRIIEHTFQALQEEPIELCVITGETAPKDFSIPKSKIGVVKGLSYGKKNSPREAKALFGDIRSKASQLLGGEPDLWHIHNHSLGKNAEATKAFLHLAKQKQPVLFHIHDFAEDNRAENYQYLSKGKDDSSNKRLIEILYPQAPHVHYAVLNGRDQKYLREAGFYAENLHLLSNPVNLMVNRQDNQKSDHAEKLILYPCRVIPRKNIGEFLLWAALAKKKEHFAVTLAPKNEKYRSGYNDWVNFASKHKLPVTFEAGDKLGMTFPELLQRADAFMSTSIAEGFGLIYLESWLAERPLLGRILPDIVADFKNKGIAFPGMYSQLKIPVSWIGEEQLKDRFGMSITQNFEKYGLKIDAQLLQDWFAVLLADDQVDFGKLDPEYQQKVIEKVIGNPKLRAEILPPNLTETEPSHDTIKSNKKRVEQEFSLSKYGDRLAELYKQIEKNKAGSLEYINAKSLLHKFQSPQNFSLLRS